MKKTQIVINGVVPAGSEHLLEALRARPDLEVQFRRDDAGAQPAMAEGALTAVINAKGGAGASLVALNLAHMTAVQTGGPVALLDLDLQFGALPSALDLDQGNSLIEALYGAEQLDETALQGFMARHDSGVHVLSAMREQIPLTADIRPEALARLLTLVRRRYAHVVVDLPCQLDPLTALVLAQAGHAVVVMQQNLSHIRAAKRLLRAMSEHCGVSRERMTLLINRYSDKDSVRAQDIRETINPPALTLLPNDFAVVSDSLNTGVPLQEFNPAAPVSRALFALAARLNGSAVTPSPPPRRRSLRETLTVPFFRSQRAPAPPAPQVHP